MKCKDCGGDCDSLLDAMKKSRASQHANGEHCPACFNAGYDARDTREAQDRLALAEHILALETDPYLQGHPEWEPLLNEAMLLRNRA